VISDHLPVYSDLFIGRMDDYAIQLPDGHYRRVGKPLESSDVFDHLMGVRSYGTYVTDERGCCRFAVLDADDEQGLQHLWGVHERLMSLNYPSYMESSRRGGHLWIFFMEPARASRVRAWLAPLCPQGIELYSKQDEGKGYGSLIRLPLGVHRRSGKRYAFVQRGAAGPVSVAPTVEDTLVWLTLTMRVDVPQKEPEQATKRAAGDEMNQGNERHPHTSFSPFPPLSPSSQRSPTSIREWCAQYDPFDFIGRYVDLNNAGVGQCPFHWHHTERDAHASFKVYRPGVPGGYCWYCYAWQQGGSIFDFLKYYYHLDAGSNAMEAAAIEHGRGTSIPRPLKYKKSCFVVAIGQ
jgi:hypothetical protein